MKNSRRSQLLQHIAKITSISLLDKNFTDCNSDAFTISLDLTLDRANVSRMLNDLWRENELIKIQGRPTFYLHRKTILRKYPNSYIPAVIPKHETLQHYLDQPMSQTTIHAQEAFCDVIGNSPHESLYEIIQDMQIYSSYPQNMQTIVLHGPPKSGKSHIRQALLQSMNIDVAQSLITIDMTTIVLHKQRFQDVMKFIEQELEQDTIKVIVFENIHVLTNDPLLLHKLIDLLQYYQQLAETYEMNLLFLAIGNTLDSTTLETLAPLFQKVYQLPAFHEKTLKEKYAFVLNFMQNEADTINKTISLSTSILNCLATAAYPYNVHSLQKELRHALSYAYQQARSQHVSFISIDYMHLSDELLNSIQNVSELLPQIESISATLKEKNHFLIPATECIALQKLMHTQINKDGIILISQHKDIKLSDFVHQELRNAMTYEINALYSLSLYQLRVEIKNILDTFNVSIHDRLLDKLCYRINNLMNTFIAQTYTSNFIEDSVLSDSVIQRITDNIVQYCEDTFHVTFPHIERMFIYEYLLYSKDVLEKGNIAVLVACQGEGIAEKYAMHVNTMKYQVRCHYVNCPTDVSIQMNTYLSMIMDQVLEINEGSGVIMITDLNPLMDFDHTIKLNSDIETLTLSPTSLPLLIQIMNLVNDPATTLEDIRGYDFGRKMPIPDDTALCYDSEIRRTLDDVADKILADSLIFLNPHKATMALFRVLMQIYEDLGLHYMDDIAIRFIFHSAFMIERVIRKEPLIYKNTTNIIRSNKTIYASIDCNMQLINDVFGIQIPSSEIARLSEIFVELLEENT